MQTKNKTPAADTPTNLSPESRILRIFETRSDELRFPDVDATALKEAHAMAEETRDAVFALEEKLAEAREACVLAERQLREKSEKAHAYLRIFAAGDPELSAAIADIKWTTGERSGRKRRPQSASKTASKSPEGPPVRKTDAPTAEIAAGIAAE